MTKEKNGPFYESTKPCLVCGRRDCFAAPDECRKIMDLRPITVGDLNRNSLLFREEA